MKFLNYLSEEFWKYTKDQFSKNDVELWKNPTASELNKLARTIKYFRFVIDNKTRSVYVSDGMNTMHATIIFEILGKYQYDTGRINCGEGSVFNGKIRIIDIDKPIRKTRNEYDWSWMERYFSDFSEFEKCKDEFHKIWIKK